MLAARGNTITFILDDMPFGANVLSCRFQLVCIRSALRLLRKHHTIVTLSHYVTKGPLATFAQESVDRLAELNAIWELRGEMKMLGRQRYTALTRKQLSSSYGAIEYVVQGGYDVILVPGGVWGSSGIWVKHARSAEVRIASYDCGPNTLLLAVNGIACQLEDIPRAMSLLRTQVLSSENQSFMERSAQTEIDCRRFGIDKFSSQLQNTLEIQGRFSGAVLVALNLSWDSAALGVHQLFETNTQWIIETIRLLLEDTTGLIIVRQHPAERLQIAHSSEDYRRLLLRSFGKQSRLHFIAADDPINSYDLLEQVTAVVVHTSTIGTEAAAHGKPVVTGSSSYYSDLGFVLKARSVEQYRQYLSDAVSGRFIVTKKMREDALHCYYLTQCCNWMFTAFTPLGFPEWSKQNLSQLSQDESVQVMVKAIEQNIPIAFLNHQARIERNQRERTNSLGMNGDK
jgi:hypothetical protein